MSLERSKRLELKLNGRSGNSFDRRIAVKDNFDALLGLIGGRPWAGLIKGGEALSIEFDAWRNALSCGTFGCAGIVGLGNGRANFGREDSPWLIFSLSRTAKPEMLLGSGKRIQYK